MGWSVSLRVLTKIVVQMCVSALRLIPILEGGACLGDPRTDWSSFRSTLAVGDGLDNAKGVSMFLIA